MGEPSIGGKRAPRVIAETGIRMDSTRETSFRPRCSTRADLYEKFKENALSLSPPLYLSRIHGATNVVVVFVVDVNVLVVVVLP